MPPAASLACSRALLCLASGPHGYPNVGLSTQLGVSGRLCFPVSPYHGLMPSASQKRRSWCSTLGGKGVVG